MNDRKSVYYPCIILSVYYLLQSINQSINQLINQSINQSVNQSEIIHINKYIQPVNVYN